MEAIKNTAHAVDLAPASAEPAASERIEPTAEQFRRISRDLRASSNEDWTSLSLTRAQLRILAQLRQEGPAAVGQLAAQLGVTLPSITATVDRLVRAGLVSRED